mmetsp:Transcript_57732/g.102018  ORF Transcript_57732/g.102018 Transcript_57732/m.102018 type:complete len:203 (+) Transcript_57732:120-728(+)
MFFKKRLEIEEIVFDCVECGEQLIVQFPARRAVVIECSECSNRCSVETARGLRLAPEQIRTDDAGERADEMEAEEAVGGEACDENEIFANEANDEEKANEEAKANEEEKAEEEEAHEEAAEEELQVARAASLTASGKAALARARAAKEAKRLAAEALEAAAGRHASPATRHSSARRSSSRLIRASAAPYSREGSKDVLVTAA